MLKLMCEDDDEAIRKSALVNLDLNEATFPHMIKRIRDKDPDIRIMVYRKM